MSKDAELRRDAASSLAAQKLAKKGLGKAVKAAAAKAGRKSAWFGKAK